MMAFIEQEANEKAEEIDAKVIFLLALNYSIEVMQCYSGNCVYIYIWW